MAAAVARRRTVTDDAKKRIVGLYVASGSKSSVVRKMNESRLRTPQGRNWSLRTIGRVLEQEGIAPAPRTLPLTADEEAQIVALGQAGHAVAKIMEATGRSDNAIYRILTRAGLHEPKPRLTTGEQLAKNVRSTASGHMVWKGSTTVEGHATLWAGGVAKVFAHKAAFEQAHGPLDEDARLLNVCGRRECIAPDHWRIQGTFEEEFARLTAADPITGCRLWEGRVNSAGYGIFKYGSSQPLLAHRVAYAQEHGPLEAGQPVHHGCRNRRCVRVGHLIAGTPAGHAQMHREEKAIAEGIRNGSLEAALKAQAALDWPGWPDGDGPIGAADIGAVCR